MKRNLSWGVLWLRYRLQRLRIRLGLPAAWSCRAVLLILVALMAVAYMSMLAWNEFVTKAGTYAPQYYEPKDFDKGMDARRKKP